MGAAFVVICCRKGNVSHFLLRMPQPGPYLGNISSHYLPLELDERAWLFFCQEDGSSGQVYWIFQCEMDGGIGPINSAGD